MAGSSVTASAGGSPAALLVDQLDLGGKETGAYDIAVDTVQAGPGDTVLVMDEGNGARQILGLDPGAIRAVVVGVVDEVSVGGSAVTSACNSASVAQSARQPRATASAGPQEAESASHAHPLGPPAGPHPHVTHPAAHQTTYG